LLDFVLAAANLRSRCYSFGSVEILDVLQLFNSDPVAPITTVSTTAGLMCLEGLKVLGRHSLPTAPTVNYFRDYFIGLQNNLFTASSSKILKQLSVPGRTITAWDSFSLTVPRSLTLQQFILLVRKVYQEEVNMISHGMHLLYMSVLPTHAVRLQRPLLVFSAQASSQNAHVIHTPMLCLELTVETLDGQDMEDFPQMVLRFEGPD
jgi:hypothetical protein